MMIVLLEFYPSWLALPREQRQVYAASLREITARYEDRVQTRFFDAEALPGRNYTDFVVCETADLKAYHFMREETRAHEVYTNGWMRIKDVVMGMENAYQLYEKEKQKP
jgi:hypothetical protein